DCFRQNAKPFVVKELGSKRSSVGFGRFHDAGVGVGGSAKRNAIICNQAVRIDGIMWRKEWGMLFVRPTLAGTPLGKAILFIQIDGRQVDGIMWRKEWGMLFVRPTLAGTPLGKAILFIQIDRRQVANRGVAEDVRMRLTGHTTRSVHQKYTHLDLE